MRYALPRDACSRSPVRSQSASPPSSRSIRSPTTCATPSAARRNRCSARIWFCRAGGLSALAPTALLDTLAAGAGLARVTNFSGMGFVPRTTGTRLVQVEAVEPGYPFYGRSSPTPLPPGVSLQAGRRTVVEPSLLTALGARVGDTLALGDARFQISGTIVSAPGNTGFRAAFGPRVFIPAAYLAETKLLGFGSRAEYEAYVRLPPGKSPQALADRYRKILSAGTRPDPDGGRRSEQPERRSHPTHPVSRARGAGRVAPGRDRRVERGRRLHSPAMGDGGRAPLSRRQRTPGASSCTRSRQRRWVLPAAPSGRPAASWRSGLLPRLLAGLLPVDVHPQLSWPSTVLGMAGRRAGLALVRRDPAPRDTADTAARRAPPSV